VYPATQQWSRPIADELWLLSHHEHSGRAKLEDQRVALGLAGGIVCELLIEGHITLASEQHVFLRFDPGYARDAVGQWAMAEMDRADGQVPVGQWIWHLGEQVTRRVADRLEQAGIVEYVRAGLLGGGKRPVAVNPNLAASPRVRLMHQLTTGAVDVPTLTLGALAVSIDLDVIIARDVGVPGLRTDLVHAARDYLHQHLRDVFNAIRAAAAQANMTIRR
jgi:hypothetical protein